MTTLRQQDNNQNRIVVQSGPSKSAGPLYDTLLQQTWTSNKVHDRTTRILIAGSNYLYQLSFLYLVSYPPGLVTARLLKNDVECWPFYGSGVYHYAKGSAFVPTFLYGDQLKINFVVNVPNDWTYYSYVGLYKIPL
jgi:hypothetical protein